MCIFPLWNNCIVGFKVLSVWAEVSVVSSGLCSMFLHRVQKISLHDFMNRQESPQFSSRPRSELRLSLTTHSLIRRRSFPALISPPGASSPLSDPARCLLCCRAAAKTEKLVFASRLVISSFKPFKSQYESIYTGAEHTHTHTHATPPLCSNLVPLGRLCTQAFVVHLFKTGTNGLPLHGIKGK